MKMTERLKCPCGASAKNTSKERGRFLRRHPALCVKTTSRADAAKLFAAQLARGTRSTEPTTFEEHKEASR